MTFYSRLLLVFVMLTSFVSTGNAQDTLLMKNGQKIGSKILEISPSEVKYKKSDNPDGPTYIANAYDISVIKYKNGTMDTIRAQASSSPNVYTNSAKPTPADPFPPIRQAGPFFKYQGQLIKAREMYSILERTNDNEIKMEIKKAKNTKLLKLVGFLAIPAGIAGAIGGLMAGVGVDDGAYVGIGCGAVAVLSIATNITASSLHKKHNRNAMRLYNEKY